MTIIRIIYQFKIHGQFQTTSLMCIAGKKIGPSPKRQNGQPLGLLNRLKNNSANIYWIFRLSITVPNSLHLRAQTILYVNVILKTFAQCCIRIIINNTFYMHLHLLHMEKITFLSVSWLWGNKSHWKGTKKVVL